MRVTPHRQVLLSPLPDEPEGAQSHTAESVPGSTPVTRHCSAKPSALSSNRGPRGEGAASQGTEGASAPAEAILQGSRPRQHRAGRPDTGSQDQRRTEGGCHRAHPASSGRPCGAGGAEAFHLTYHHAFLISAQLWPAYQTCGSSSASASSLQMQQWAEGAPRWPWVVSCLKQDIGEPGGALSEDGEATVPWRQDSTARSFSREQGGPCEPFPTGTPSMVTGLQEQKSPAPSPALAFERH